MTCGFFSLRAKRPGRSLVLDLPFARKSPPGFGEAVETRQERQTPDKRRRASACRETCWHRRNRVLIFPILQPVLAAGGFISANSIKISYSDCLAMVIDAELPGFPGSYTEILIVPRIQRLLSIYASIVLQCAKTCFSFLNHCLLQNQQYQITG